jgi:hypothetical protein
MLEEDFFDLSTVDSLKVMRRLGLVLFSLDLPYFMGDSKIYHFTLKYSNLGEK